MAQVSSAASGVESSAVAPAVCPPTLAAPTKAEATELQGKARDRGFLWRLTRAGRVSYLYGTLHVGTLPWAFPGKALQIALSETDTIALEIDINDQAAMAKAVAAAKVAAAVVPPALEARMDHMASKLCLPEGALDALPPVLRAVTLSVLEGRWEGLEPSLGQEYILAGYATGAQRPLVGLESAASQIKLLGASDAKAMALAEDMVKQMEEGKSRTMLKRLATAWEQGDLATLEDYALWCECVQTDLDRAFMKRLNDDRNGPMAAKLHVLHSKGQRVFAAVGALHMTGPKGLPRLMAAKGYKVERVVFEP